MLGLPRISAFQWGRKAVVPTTSGPAQEKENIMASIAKFTTASKSRPSEAGTVHWLNDCMERAKKMPFAEVVTLSPGLAKVILDKNDGNRSVRPVKVRHFARDMRLGRWPLNGETIIIANGGGLNDGQHRLHAIIEANVSIPATLFFGADPATRTTVDQGTAKTAGDYLQMLGHTYGTVTGAVARWIMAFEESGGQNLAAAKYFTNADVTDRALRDKRITESVETTAPFAPDARQVNLTHSILAFAHYEFDADPEAIDFLRKVANGESLRSLDPAHTLRSKLLTQGYTRDQKVELLFRAWSFDQRGMKVKPSAMALQGNLPALV